MLLTRRRHTQLRNYLGRLSNSFTHIIDNTANLCLIHASWGLHVVDLHEIVALLQGVIDCQRTE